MDDLFAELCLKTLLFPGPGFSNISMIRSQHAPFKPEKLLELNLVSSACGFQYSKNALAAFVFGEGHQFCDRYRSAVYELFTKSDRDKIHHYASHLLLLKEFASRMLGMDIK